MLNSILEPLDDGNPSRPYLIDVLPAIATQSPNSVMFSAESSTLSSNFKGRSQVSKFPGQFMVSAPFTQIFRQSKPLLLISRQTNTNHFAHFSISLIGQARKLHLSRGTPTLFAAMTETATKTLQVSRRPVISLSIFATYTPTSCTYFTQFWLTNCMLPKDVKAHV
jgi:hypothetical protein